MDAITYNREGLGVRYFGRDLPPAWAGRKILYEADRDASGEIDKFEKDLVDWPAFTEAVREFQVLCSLYVDAKLGGLTLRALREEFLDGRGPIQGEEIVVAQVGDLKFRRPIETSAPPARLLTEGPSQVRDCWNLYGAAIAEEAGRLNIPITAALAVFATESRGAAYDPLTGLAIIRVEKAWKGGVWRTRYKRHDRSGEVDFRKAFGAGQGGEWRGLAALAKDKGSEFACFWSSWGLGQVMGFNHDTVGYPDASSMAQAFQLSCRAQIKGFGRIIEKNGLEDEIRREDFRPVAVVYNGTGQPDYYASVIRSNLAAAKLLKLAA